MHSEYPPHAHNTSVYPDLLLALDALLAGERDMIANLANCSALLFSQLPGLNWAGFYLWRSNELVLGPFQGKPACIRIAKGRGVCGHAAQSRSTLIVADVHAFADHIACDAASQSEIVVPLMTGDRLLGVLDLDSPFIGRFNTTDAKGLETVAAKLIAATDFHLNRED
jgi:GAF domain-containing protein